MEAIGISTVGTMVAGREVVALEVTAPICDAARLMTERNIGSVAVREGGELVGLVTERDVVAVFARGGDPGQRLGEAMRASLPRVPSGASEAACAALMRDHATRHLLVEDAGRVVGLVSMRDLIQQMLDDRQHEIEQLNVYIAGH